MIFLDKNPQKSKRTWSNAVKVHKDRRPINKESDGINREIQPANFLVRDVKNHQNNGRRASDKQIRPSRPDSIAIMPKDGESHESILKHRAICFKLCLHISYRLYVILFGKIEDC